MTFEEIKLFVKFDDSITPDTPWGVAIGSMTLGSYLNIFIKPESFGMTLERSLEILKEVYGYWIAFSSYADYRVAYHFTMLDVVTIDGNSAEEIGVFYQEFENALLANDFRFVKRDENGYAHYVKDQQEFKIKNNDNKSIDISGATIYLSCCALGSD